MTSPVSKDWPRKKYTNEHERKCHKPILEKKRRARINKSLDQLKSLLLETMNGEAGHFSKLEKADILEMTVKHLQEIQQSQLKVAMVIDPTVKQKYHSGYSECTGEVDRYLSTVDGLQPEVKGRLMGHLDMCNRLQPNAQSSPSQPLSGFQNFPRVIPSIPGLQTQPLVGPPVSPPMYQSLLNVNRSHKTPRDTILPNYNTTNEASSSYPSPSNSLSKSTNKTHFGDRLQYISGLSQEKPHTITSQSTLSENQVSSESNTHVLMKQTVPSSSAIDKENSTKRKIFGTQNYSVRKFGENQSKPLGDLNINSLHNRINPIRNSESGSENQRPVSHLHVHTNRSNFSRNSSVSASMNDVKEESMWRPW